MHQAIHVFSRKLAKGIFYREVAWPFPNDGCLLLNWFTNAELLRNGKYPAFDLLKELDGEVPPLQRSGRYLNDQFEYKLSLSAQKQIFVLQARFANSFGLVVFGSVLPGQLEGIITSLRQQTQHDGPFVVLQSPSLVQDLSLGVG